MGDFEEIFGYADAAFGAVNVLLFKGNLFLTRHIVGLSREDFSGRYHVSGFFLLFLNGLLVG